MPSISEVFNVPGLNTPVPTQDAVPANPVVSDGPIEVPLDLTALRAELKARKTCLDCARKHVTKARAKIVEAPLGYARHAWYAVGELAEAEDEVVAKYPELAKLIRAHRLDIMDSLDPNTVVTAGIPMIPPDLIQQPAWDLLLDTLINEAVTVSATALTPQDTPSSVMSAVYGVSTP